MNANPFGIGRPVPRKEDLRLLTGRGRYTDDHTADGMLHAVVLRSPHGHARIRSLDVAAAQRAPGVAAVLTVLDWRVDGLGPMPLMPNTTDINEITRPALTNSDGSELYVTPIYPLAAERVRHVGEPVALVVAETLAAAQDAAELITVDYESLPAVTDAERALGPDAPTLWDAVPGNLWLDAEKGDAAATACAIAGAAHVIRRRFVNNRVTAVSMEPRGALGSYDAATDRYELVVSSQGPHRVRDPLVRLFGIAPETLRVHCQDVGGGFGMKNYANAEHALVLWAAKRLGRPVKWIATRQESFISDMQARDLITDATLALDRHGRMVALDVSHIGNVGAHSISLVPLANGSNLITTVYAIPVAHVRIRGALTNTLSTGPYRGAGRPEATMVIERLIDAAAAETGMDRIALRRLNLIPADGFPWRNPVDVTYDCGAFAENMETVLKGADWDGFAARRADARARGRLRGIGLANYLETPVGFLRELVEIAVDPAGQVDVRAGTFGHGQGHETSYSQVIAELLGVPFEAVNIIQGDTAEVKEGGGTHSDRSMRLAGTLMHRGCQVIIGRARAIAAHLLEAAETDLAFADGAFTVAGTDRAIGLFEVAARATGDDIPEELRGALEAAERLANRVPAYPTGAAVCEVEVDPDTGAVAILRWTAVDDAGRIINPLIVKGQVHGGIAQGVGQAMLEDLAYEEGTGQPRGGSFLDYAMPRADLLPSFEVISVENAPTQGNPLGVKGGGESGTTPALAAFMNALTDALRDAGAADVAMPATPERVWRALRSRPG